MELFAPRALAGIIGEMFGGVLWAAAIVLLLDIALVLLALRRGVQWRPAARIRSGLASGMVLRWI